MLNTPDEFPVWLEERAAEAEEGGFLLRAAMIWTLTVIDFVDEDYKRLNLLATRSRRRTFSAGRRSSSRRQRTRPGSARMDAGYSVSGLLAAVAPALELALPVQEDLDRAASAALRMPAMGAHSVPTRA